MTAVADGALTVAAVLGTVCIVLAIAAALFDVRIVLFRTGSMEPTIPAGSAAVVRGIPASDVEVGDVVMVEREGELPITHRVVSVAAVPAAGDARSLTMRGDANSTDDPAPYEVTHVRRVLFSVPGAAPALAAAGSPWVLGGLTLAATTLIVVVFWPRRGRREAASTHPAPGDDPGDDATRRARRATGVGAAIVLVAGAAVFGTAPPARAAPVGTETIVQGEVIRLVSIESARMRTLAPGTAAVWQVGVSADAATPGRIAVALEGTAAAPAPLRLEVRGCPTRWTTDSCPGSDVLVADAAVPTDGTSRVLQTMRDDAQLWLRIVVSMPSDAGPALPEVLLTVRATGAGDTVSTGPGGELAGTGLDTRPSAVAVGVVLLAIGAGAALRFRRRT
ncbi:hypothetical protein GCM10025773_33950 [Microbacterium jejuense]